MPEVAGVVRCAPSPGTSAGSAWCCLASCAVCSGRFFPALPRLRSCCVPLRVFVRRRSLHRVALALLSSTSPSARTDVVLFWANSVKESRAMSRVVLTCWVLFVSPSTAWCQCIAFSRSASFKLSWHLDHVVRLLCRFLSTTGTSTIWRNGRPWCPNAGRRSRGHEQGLLTRWFPRQLERGLRRRRELGSSRLRRTQHERFRFDDMKSDFITDVIEQPPSGRQSRSM